MTLTIGLIILVVFIFGLGLAKRVCSNPGAPLWLKDTVIGSIYLPLLTGVLALGVSFVAAGCLEIFAGTDPVVSADTAVAIVLAAALVLGLYSPRIRHLVFGSISKPAADSGGLLSEKAAPPTAPGGVA